MSASNGQLCWLCSLEHDAARSCAQQLQAVLSLEPVFVACDKSLLTRTGVLAVYCNRLSYCPAVCQRSPSQLFQPAVIVDASDNLHLEVL